MKHDERSTEIQADVRWLTRAHRNGVNVADALTFKEAELRTLEAVVAADPHGPTGLMVAEAIAFRREVARFFCSALSLTPGWLVARARELADGEDVLL
jgi:hypothetical protein